MLFFVYRFLVVFLLGVISITSLCWSSSKEEFGIESLPPEVTLKIFVYVGTIKPLAYLSQVSTKFSSYAGDWQVWQDQEVRFDKAGLAKLSEVDRRPLWVTGTEAVTTQELEGLKNFPKIKNLGLENCQALSSKALLSLASWFPKLEVLRLWEYLNLNDQDLGEFIKTQSFLRVLNVTCAGDLTDLFIANSVSLPELKSLILDACAGVSFHSVNLSQHFPNLQELSLDFCETVDDKTLEQIATLNRLRHLSLQDCSLITNAGINDISKLLELRRLMISGCTLVTDDAFQYLFKCPELVELEAAMCPGIGDAGVGHLNGCPSLKFLNFRFNKLLTDNSVETFMTLPKIENLALAFCLEITLDGILQMTTLPTLKVLDVRGNVKAFRHFQHQKSGKDFKVMILEAEEQ